MRHSMHRLGLRILTHRGALMVVLVMAISFTILACSQEPGSSSTAADTGADAMKAYKDPKTGKLVPPPEGSTDPKPSEAVQDATNTSSKGLESKPAPGGGEMIDLKGRFQSNQSPSTDSDKTTKSASPKKEGSRLRAYIDPETGKLASPPDAARVPPPALTASPAVQSATSTSSADFEAKPAPGGGMMIDLKGRFNSRVFATKDKNGKIVISHTPDKSHN